MKLQLAEAVLVNADILLMDEPTNHLHSKTVEWLERYLKGLKHKAAVIVCCMHYTLLGEGLQ